MADNAGTAGTVNVRIRQGGQDYTFDIADFGPYPLFSSMVFATTQSAELTAFNYAIGGNISGTSSTQATKYDTNMLSGNQQLGAAEEMLVYALRAVLPPDITLADIKDVLKKTYVAVYISTQKPAIEGQIGFFPAGGGIAGQSTNNASEQWTNGHPAASAGRVFASPHYLRGGVNFWGQATFQSALSLSATVKLTMVLDGLRKRPVA